MRRTLSTIAALLAVVGLAYAANNIRVPIAGGDVATIATTETGGVHTLSTTTSTAAGGDAVQGGVASAATDSGNPVKIGGVFRSTTPTFTDGQRGDIQLGARGSMRVELLVPSSGSAIGTTATTANGASTTINGYNVGAFNMLQNGSTWDMARSIINANNSTGTGIAAVGLTAQLDDTSPTTITENQFGNLRMDTARSLRVSTEGQKLTYRAAVVWSPTATSATDIFIINGSGTRTVRVNWIRLSLYATAASTNNTLLVKRSTANSGGTAAAATLVPVDSGNSAATATVNTYTANPTPGTTVGLVGAQLTQVSHPTNGPIVPTVWEFSTRNGQSVVLRGTAEGLAINVNGASLAGFGATAEIEWTEE